MAELLNLGEATVEVGRETRRLIFRSAGSSPATIQAYYELGDEHDIQALQDLLELAKRLRKAHPQSTVDRDAEE